YLEYLRSQGLAGFVPAGPVRARLQYLHDQRGITFDTIAERVSLSRDAVCMQYRGYNKLGQEIRSCEMATERKILGARFGPEDCYRFPVLGIRRRLRALTAVGYTSPFLAERL